MPDDPRDSAPQDPDSPDARPVPDAGPTPGDGPTPDAGAATDDGSAIDAALPRAWLRDDPAFEERVLRAFVRDGRLRSLPARERKKLVLYRYLVDRIFPDPTEVVAERDVNMRIALLHPDPATIRRALVDLGFVRRDGMAYRRVVPRRDA